MLGTELPQRMSTAGGEIHFAGGTTGYDWGAADTGFSVQTSRNIAVGLDGYMLYPLAYAGRLSLRANPFGDHVAFVVGAGGGSLIGSPFATLDVGLRAGVGGPRDFVHFVVGLSAVESFPLLRESVGKTAFYGVSQASLWFGPPQTFSVGVSGSFTLGVDTYSGHALYFPGVGLTIRVPINDHGP
jgi:hypothetical protein